MLAAFVDSDDDLSSSSSEDEGEDSEGVGKHKKRNADDADDDKSSSEDEDIEKKSSQRVAEGTAAGESVDSEALADQSLMNIAMPAGPPPGLPPGPPPGLPPMMVRPPPMRGVPPGMAPRMLPPGPPRGRPPGIPPVPPMGVPPAMRAVPPPVRMPPGPPGNFSHVVFVICNFCCLCHMTKILSYYIAESRVCIPAAFTVSVLCVCCIIYTCFSPAGYRWFLCGSLSQRYHS